MDKAYQASDLLSDITKGLDIDIEGDIIIGDLDIRKAPIDSNYAVKPGTCFTANPNILSNLNNGKACDELNLKIRENGLLVPDNIIVEETDQSWLLVSAEEMIYLIRKDSGKLFVYDKRFIIKSKLRIIDSEIQGKVSFNAASFFGEVNFLQSRFYGDSDFGGVRFNQSAYFRSSCFESSVSFCCAHFAEVSFFNHASFNKSTNFYGCRFIRDVWFSYASFNESISFLNSEFFGQQTEFDECLFRANPMLMNAIFSQKVMPGSFSSMGWAYRKSSLFNASYFFHKAGERLFDIRIYQDAAEQFRNAKIEYEKEGNYNKANRMYVKEKICVKKSSKFWKKIKYWLWEITCNYGDSWIRFAGVMAVIIIIFMLIYIFNQEWLCSYKGNLVLRSLYFSFVVFTTLGFGDITPVGNAGMVCVIIEVIFGYLMLGMLITLVVRKMTWHN